MSDKFYKICIVLVLITIVLNIVSIVLNSSTSNMLGLVFSVVLLLFFVIQQKKELMNGKRKRDLKFNFHKGGSGSFTPRMSVPKKWADEMGITRENPNVTATFEGDRIIIEKAKNE